MSVASLRHTSTIRLYLRRTPCPASSSPSTSTTSTPSIAFYSTLFGTEPAKVRPGYANFAVAEPPLKLVLIENPGQGGTLNHLGVEVADATPSTPSRPGSREAGLASIDERGTTCCYAKQDKFWVGGRARTASAGRSTPCSPTARPRRSRRGQPVQLWRCRDDCGRPSCRVLLTNAGSARCAALGRRT